ncbi:MAG TPA: chemotaxis protein CheB [Usitatibacter sp.]|nr:chemotaxis protein CheB [Usitatibacter sp.]
MRYDVIAIVASARGVSPMRRLLKRLPVKLPAAVLCLADCRETLASELAAETGLEVRTAKSGERVEPGRVYLSPPGRTPLLVDDHTISLAPYGPESVALQPQDHFLCSIAAQYGSRALCIVLGNFDGDGVRGAQAVKERGGTVLVLDRQTALHWGMAEPIIRAGAVDRVLDAEEVAEALRAWFTPCGILECAELQFRLGELLETVLRSSGTRMGNIRLLDAESESLRIIVHRGLEKPLVECVATVRRTEEAACARAFRFRQRVVIEDVEADVQYRPYLEVARRAGFRSVQSTPLFAAQAKIAGVLSTQYPYAHALSAGEARLLDEAAMQAQPLMARFEGMR